jgi:UDP-GlcNAc:undecaprenyl-phosphate/decaprenyl-phosphate GlcNAc-1-phosphate transferase
MIVFGLLLILLAASTAAFLTWCVREVAQGYGWTFAADSERHLHPVPVPRLGGVGIFLSFSLLLCVQSIVLGASSRWMSSNLIAIAVSTAVLFCVGLYDDFRGLGPVAKFSAQAICGALLFWFGFRFELYMGSSEWATFAEFIFTLLWVMALSNSFNLVDGIDGLAGGTAFVSAVIIFVVALYLRDYTVASAAAILAGALLGFLRFNYHPASIFMGDCGSLFVGGLLAALSLALTRSLEPGFVAVMVPILCCAFPLFETLLSFTRRLTTGKHPFHADREHIHHRLLDRGLGQRKAVWILHLLSTICAIAALMLLSGSWWLKIFAVAVPAMTFSGLAINLGYHRFSPVARDVGATPPSPKYVHALRRHLRRASDLKSLATYLEQSLWESDFDGFDLLPNDAQALYLAAPFPVCSWSRPNGSRPEISTRWNLSIQLGTRKMPALGHIILYRDNARGPINADLEQVLRDVRDIVSSQLERVLRHQFADTWRNDSYLGKSYLIGEHTLPDLTRMPGAIEESSN